MLNASLDPDKRERQVAQDSSESEVAEVTPSCRRTFTSRPHAAKHREAAMAV